MKILIDARTLGEKPSGIGMYLYSFAKGLARNSEFQISLLTDICESKEIRELKDTYGMSVYTFGRRIRKGPDLWRYFHFLKKTIGEVKPEIFWEVNNLLPIRLKNPYGKYVVTIHDIFPLTMPECYGEVYARYFRFGLNKTLRCCDAVLFDSVTMEQEILERYPALKGLPRYVSSVMVPEKERESLPRKGYYLYVGNLEKRKGSDILLEAYRLYRQNGGERELLLAGKLRDKDVKARLDQIQKETAGLHYLGYISDEERDHLYRECHTMLFPSRAEGFGMPLIEALNYKTPVIASRIPIFEELAGDSVTWYDLETGAAGLAELMLRDEKKSVEWRNPYTEDHLTQGLKAFFQSLAAKRIRFDGQVFMDPVLTGIGTLAWETTREAMKDRRFSYHVQAFTMGRTAEQLDRLASAGFAQNERELCKWYHRGLYLRTYHWLPLPHAWFFPQKADVDVFWNYDTPPGVKGKAAVYVHDMTCMACPETMDASVRKILQRNIADTCRRADAILTLSAFSKKEIIQYLGVRESKIHVIPCGVDHSVFCPEDSPELSRELRQKYGIYKEYLLYLGTLEPRKNIALLLDAYSELLRRLGASCPQLVLAGKKGWQFEKLEPKLQGKDLQDHLIVTEYVPYEEVPKLMRGALTFVFPSLYEGFGLPPVEAMACGTPVIVSDRASLPEVVGDAGLVVPVETPDALVDAMQLLLENPELRMAYARRGEVRARKYTWENAAKKLLEVCDSL